MKVTKNMFNKKSILLIIIAIIILVLLVVVGCSHKKINGNFKGGVYILMEAQTDATGDHLSELMEQTKLIIEQRCLDSGIRYGRISIEDGSRIRVELPGEKDADEQIKAVGQTAQLKFLLADGTEALTGADIADAGVQPDQQRGGYLVTLKFTADGAKKFLDATTKASAGDVLSENIMKGEDGEVAQTIDGDVVQASSIVIMLDDAILSAPTAKEPIDSRDIEITGDFTQKEAAELSMLIRGGALPVVLKAIESGLNTQ